MNSTQTENIEEIAPESEMALASDDSGILPPKQELALQAVISHHTLKEAALAAGISETTLWRYMRDTAFSRRLHEARRDAVGHALLRLQRASSDAVSILYDVMKDKDTPASARITAIRTVLEYSLRGVEVDDLATRIEQLEDFIRYKQNEDAIYAAIS